MIDNYVTDLDVTNLKGIENLTVKMGRFLTIIHGDNGMGKTSAIDSLRAAFGGGHRPELIRKGQKKALVVIKLKSGHTIEKHISPKTSRLEITGPDGQPVPETEQKFVEQLAAGFAFDPLGLLKAEKKDRLKFLADAMPLVFTQAELKEALGGIQLAGDISKGFPTGEFTMTGWSALSKLAYDARRKANGIVEEKLSTINSLSGGIEGVDESDNWTLAADEAAAEVLKLSQARAKKHKEFDDILTEEKARLDKLEQAELALVRQRFQQQRDAVFTQSKETMRKFDEGDPADSSPGMLKKISDAQEKETKAKERARLQQRAAGARDTLTIMRKQLAEETKNAAALDAAVNALEKLKQDKVAAQPVPCEVRDGEIFVDGIAFDDLNKAKQINLCLQLGSLKTGQLGFMVMDELEAFSGKTMAKFEEDVRGSGFQILGAKVSDAEKLTVEARP